MVNGVGISCTGDRSVRQHGGRLEGSDSIATKYNIAIAGSERNVIGMCNGKQIHRRCGASTGCCGTHHGRAGSTPRKDRVVVRAEVHEGILHGHRRRQLPAHRWVKAEGWCCCYR